MIYVYNCNLVFSLISYKIYYFSSYMMIINQPTSHDVFSHFSYIVKVIIYFIRIKNALKNIIIF